MHVKFLFFVGYRYIDILILVNFPLERFFIHWYVHGKYRCASCGLDIKYSEKKMRIITVDQRVLPVESIF